MLQIICVRYRLIYTCMDNFSKNKFDNLKGNNKKCHQEQNKATNKGIHSNEDFISINIAHKK